MSEHSKFWLIVWGLITVMFCTLVICITIHNVSVNRNASAQGLVQGSLPGLQGWYWVKP